MEFITFCNWFHIVLWWALYHFAMNFATFGDGIHNILRRISKHVVMKYTTFCDGFHNILLQISQHFVMDFRASRRRCHSCRGLRAFRYPCGSAVAAVVSLSLRLFWWKVLRRMCVFWTPCTRQADSLYMCQIVCDCFIFENHVSDKLTGALTCIRRCASSRWKLPESVRNSSTTTSTNLSSPAGSPHTVSLKRSAGCRRKLQGISNATLPMACHW